MSVHLLLLLLVLFTFSVSAEVSVSIDCGGTGSYSDDNSISWTDDSLYIQTGENKVVENDGSVPHVVTTLRVFTFPKKNCYSIDAVKGDRVLVRPFFYYGNYDKKSSPPTFDLFIDGNYRDTVVTLIDELIYYETIYTVKGDTISVCVAQTKPNQFPFMSALEVRTLDASMYGQVDSNHALFLRRRVAFGTNDTVVVRYPDDIYDRIWRPVIVSDGFTQLAGDGSTLTVDLADNPPKAVLESAITTTSTTNSLDSIKLSTNLPDKEVPIHMTMYFSEVSELDSTQNRSFAIYINKELSSDPIIPPYGSVMEIYISNITASSNTSITLVPTSDSTLPPLINAMEVFVVSDPLVDGTYGTDVEALVLLQTQFDVLQEWSGDPCVPASFSWDWVTCSSDATPRITTLQLSSFGLSGSLPDLSSMDALETIDLHNNSLNGDIPDFLGTLANLKELNLASNDFSGPIPSSLSSNKNLKFDVSGNQNLCVSGNSCKSTNSNPKTSSGTSSSSKKKDKKNKNLIIILGTTIPASFILALGALVGTLHHRRKAAASASINPGQKSTQSRPNGQPQQPIATPLKPLISEYSIDVAQQATSEHVDDHQEDDQEQQEANEGEHNDRNV